jgi:hypothetical protein
MVEEESEVGSAGTLGQGEGERRTGDGILRSARGADGKHHSKRASCPLSAPFRKSGARNLGNGHRKPYRACDRRRTTDQPGRPSLPPNSRFWSMWRSEEGWFRPPKTEILQQTSESSQDLLLVRPFENLVHCYRPNRWPVGCEPAAELFSRCYTNVPAAGSTASSAGSFMASSRRLVKKSSPQIGSSFPRRHRPPRIAPCRVRDPPRIRRTSPRWPRSAGLFRSSVSPPKA